MHSSALSESENGRLALLAAEIATKAASHIRSRSQELSTPDLSVQTKSSPTDPVTILDRESETLIRKYLAQFRPEDQVLGEENITGITSIKKSSPIRWIIDPLDGTVNFLYQVPAYAVSIACEREGTVVAACVRDIPNEVTYVAALGCGAYRYDRDSSRKLSCSSPVSLDLALIGTGFSCMPNRRKQQAKIFSQLLGKVRDVRRFGAAALDCCRVAEGTIDAYYEHGISGWDYAAGQLIAAEAGAQVFTPPLDISSHQGELTFISCKSIASQLKDTLAELGGLSPISE